jgi:hypothetical protein
VQYDDHTNLNIIPGVSTHISIQSAQEHIIAISFPHTKNMVLLNPVLKVGTLGNTLHVLDPEKIHSDVRSQNQNIIGTN